MPLEQSPSLNDFDPTPEPPQPPPQSGKKVFRYLTAGLAMLVLALVLGNLGTGGLTSVVSGTGTVRGLVLDENGLPLPDGYVKILGTDLTAPLAPDGTFEIKNVPVGQRSLVVLDQYTGMEISCAVVRGDFLDLGLIRFRTTTVPEP